MKKEYQILLFLKNTDGVKDILFAKEDVIFGIKIHRMELIFIGVLDAG